MTPPWLADAPHPADMPQEHNEPEPEPAADVSPPDWIDGTKATWGQEPAEIAAKRLAAMPDVFIRANGAALVWLDDRGWADVRPRMQDMNLSTVKGLLDQRRIIFASKQYDPDRKTYTRRTCAPPNALCDRIVTTRPGDDWRIIRGVADAPYLLADGSLVNEPGYRDGLWLCRNSALDLTTIPADMRPVEGGWDAEMSAHAAGMILSELCEVEWQSRSDKSAAFAYLLTLLSRPAYRLAPIFLFTAPGPGSGKDLVAKCMENAAFGFDAIRINPPPGRNDDAAAEMDKKIGAAMLEGESTIVLGDIKRLISPTIYGLTTEERAQGFRVLGVSQAIPVPRNLTLVGVGNNPEIGADLVRRSVSIRLTPSSANPEERTFTRSEADLIAHYRNDRPSILAMATNIIRGALAAPTPQMIPCPFTGWARMVQAACIHAGLGDPLQGRDVLRARVTDEDPRRALAPFAIHWWSYFGNAWKRASDLLSPLQGDATEMTRDYRAALHELCATPSAIVLGKMLSAADDAIFDVQNSAGAPIRVRLHRKTSNGSKWFQLLQVS